MTNHLEDDDKNYETVIGVDGKPMRIIRDGARVHVSLLDAMASRHQLSDVERYVLQDQEYRTRTAAHRPGWRVTDSKQVLDARRAVEDAYRAYDQERESAWVNPNSDVGAGESQFIGARENDLCTRDGYPGRLRYNDEGNLECVLDHPNGSADRRTLDQKMEDHQLRMDEEYRAYARRKSEEWRGR